MKIHYINILLFELPLNILIYNQRNHKSPTSHTYTNRSLCECKLYSPANYDSDTEMKEVMQQFEVRTSQRFHEYDDRMKTTRQKCKEQCDKEIQKIILKDKLEKELNEKFLTLQTDIQNDAIPTCICEKTMADKTEKFCLNCGVNVGGGITLSSGVLGGIGAVAVNAWKDAALEAAIAAAKEAGAAAGLKAGDALGMKIVLHYLEELGVKDFCPVLFKSIGISTRYNDSETIISAILAKKAQECTLSASNRGNPVMCETFGLKFGLTDPITLGPKGPPANEAIPQTIKGLVAEATTTAGEAAEAAEKSATAAAIKTSTEAIEATSYNWYTTIAYSITAILIIVLIMVIIYLILRYRRKKKMKKKLQYIKLLEE
ncbi:hypothetical protein PFBG_06057 [Plasmodium falciparum 7G8]|uniref:Rifin n=1 Tax=Plasmodium falciparum (isolate 7G8) TaxID=57266 RepID=W7EZH2_PLAF8|nr:hypothetical protein PFBG_06057 [Plasmodium falciparum 7G8]